MGNFFVKATGGPGHGVFPDEVYASKCVNRSGSAMEKGDIVELDLTASVAEIDTTVANNYLPGSITSIWRTIIAPTATSIAQGGIFGVVREEGGIANDAEGEVVFYGIVDEAFCISAATSGIAAGAYLTPTTGLDLDGVVLSTELLVARFLAPTDVTMTTHALKRVFFNGFQMAGYAQG